MHQESQLVYAATGTMQVTTPKGRWLVPPDRAVWVPARLGHAIDMLADIEMRTLYFDLAWLKREGHGKKLAKEFVVRVSPLLHQTILALFDERNEPERTLLLVRLAMMELERAEDSATFIPVPQEPRCRRAADIVLGDPTADHEIETLARAVGTSARTLVAAVRGRDATFLQELVPACPHCSRHPAAVGRRQPVGEAACLRSGLCQRAGIFPCLPAGHRQDADGIRRERVMPIPSPGMTYFRSRNTLDSDPLRPKS